MDVANVSEKDLKEMLDEKTKLVKELQERIAALEDALNERDLAIYNLAVKISKL